MKYLVIDGLGPLNTNIVERVGSVVALYRRKCWFYSSDMEIIKNCCGIGHINNLAFYRAGEQDILFEHIVFTEIAQSISRVSKGIRLEHSGLVTRRMQSTWKENIKQAVRTYDASTETDALIKAAIKKREQKLERAIKNKRTTKNVYKSGYVDNAGVLAKKSSRSDKKLRIVKCGSCKQWASHTKRNCPNPIFSIELEKTKTKITKAKKKAVSTAATN